MAEIKNLTSSRKILLNSVADTKSFPSNRTKTTKYTVWNFVFKNLFEQFRRLANFYFLLIVIVEVIPEISPLSPIASIVPLVVVLVVTAIKEAFEDFKRYQADRQVNNTLAKVMIDGEFVDVAWKDIRVGDFVKVLENEEFPADLVAISCSNPNGVCYIETSNLDGESGLKTRYCVNATLKCTEPRFLSAMVGWIEAPAPNIHIDSFDATLELTPIGRRPEVTVKSNSQGTGPAGASVPLYPTNLLLRGATLQSTEWVYGIVVYTGKDTKVIMNQQKAPSKFTHVERILNKYVIFLMCFVILLCLSCSMVGLFWQVDNAIRFSYLQISPQETTAAASAFLTYAKFLGTYFALFSNIIPISLYVSMEFVKLVGAYLIQYDPDLYDAKSQKPIFVKTSNLLEELGQVSHVLTDKTGTLTKNKMKLRKCTVGGDLFTISKSSENCAGNDDELQTEDEIEEKQPQLDLSSENLPHLSQFKKTDHHDSEDKLDLETIKKNPQLLEFFTHMALNHTAMIKQDDRTEILEESRKSQKRIDTTSPDEEALIKGMQDVGFDLEARGKDYLTISIGGVKGNYKLLNVLEFSSARKRMSVLVVGPNGKIQLLCKGADSVIYERLAADNPKKLLQQTQQHIDFYSTKGLRTLCFAQKYVSSDEYSAWKSIFDEASLAIHDRTKKVEKAMNLIEKNLYLQGATAIEDKLQEHVPETLSALLRAKIKVWVLTGDKQETAISIGKSCSLISPQSHILKLNADSAEKCRVLMNQFKSDMQSDRSHVLVIDGKSLTFSLGPNMIALFLEISLKCDCVICCRVSPMQKAQVVATVKKHNKNFVTLAIGDGANDVSMIQEADVGVGIRGREGSQASRNADFSFSKFHMLRKLMLVHGRYSYVRVTYLIQFSFYKNLALTLMQFYYCFFNGFSGQTLLDSWMISVFNLFFTSVPIIIYAILEKDVPERFLMQFPELYSRSKKSSDLNNFTFLQWITYAILHSVIFFFGALLVWHPVASQSGQVYGLWSFGTICCSVCVLTVTAKLALSTLHWTWITLASMALSIGLYFLFLLLFGYVTFLPQIDMFLLFLQLGSTNSFWITLLLLVVLSLFPDYAFMWIKQYLFPSDWQIVKEHIKGSRKKSQEEVFLIPKRGYGSFT